MSILNGITVVPAIVIAAYGIFRGFTWILARAAAIQERSARRYWVTLYTRTCDRCRHVWERMARDYDPDLGFRFDRTETCPACRAESGRIVEIDFGRMSAEDIARAFDREHVEATM